MIQRKALGTLWMLLLAGCSQWAPPFTYGDAEEGREQRSRAGAKGSLACPVVLQKQHEPGMVPQSEADALLGFRRVQCARPKEERDQLIQEYREQSSRHAVMRTLMLATCAPDQTPGLLANALVEARHMEPHTSDIAALLDLIAAEAESYALLERRLNSTRQKLDDMIQGIRAIEAEMGEVEQP